MSKTKRFAHSRRNNPRRGFPGVLCFCETGKEIKCEREAKDILQYYYEKSHEDRSDQSVGQTLTLEEEIAMINNGGMSDSASFLKVYDTGCRGTVFLISTLQNSELIDVVRSRAPRLGEKINSDEKADIDSDTSDVDDSSRIRESKRIKVMKSNNYSEVGIKWDPVNCISTIFQGIKEKDAYSPSSRFITRMVPIQVTCHAAMEEIVPNIRELLRKFLIPHGISAAESSNVKEKILPTFRISFKRRLCDHLKTNEVIESVAGVIQELTRAYFAKTKATKECILNNPQLFDVDLTSPDYTIIIEICRTLVGMSVVKNASDFNNFNLNITKEKLI